MKIGFLVFISFFAISSFAKGSSGKKSRYPQVQMVEGTVHQVEDVIAIVNREPVHTEKLALVKKSAVLKDKALLRSEEKSRMRLALSGSSTLVLDEDSEIRLPEINWKDGAVKEIDLHEGSLRYVCKSECNRKVITPLYEGDLPAGDFLIEYDSEIPQVEVSVISGDVVFGGLGNESSLTLHSGEKASFKGVLENDEPAFDILLKGRKVAKGKISEVQKVPAEVILKLQKQDQAQIQIAKRQAKPKRLPSQICNKPFGELNQCVWTCEKNKKGAKECLVDRGAQCVRRRCNANGEWSDRQELSSSQSPCKVESFVGTCDY